MKKYLFLFLIVASCKNTNSKAEFIEIRKGDTELKKFYESDEIEHFYLNISEDQVAELLGVENKNEDERSLLDVLVSSYPDSISEPNFETKLIKYKFIKTRLNDKERKEVDNVFTQKDSLQTVYSMCLPYYRDIFIFKKEKSIVGIAKVCFGCGESRFIGTKVDTRGFGLNSDLSKLYKIIRKE